MDLRLNLTQRRRSSAVALTTLAALTLLPVFAWASARGATGATPAVDFNRDVRPILSGTCFKCHGIDDASRKAKLRLDVRDAAVAPLKDGDRAIVPGKPELSELVRRVFSGEEDEVMPPAKTGVRLTNAQKEYAQTVGDRGGEV